MRKDISVICMMILCAAAAACGCGGGDGGDGGLDGDVFNLDAFEFVDLTNPCELPAGVVPDPQWGAEANTTGDPIGGGAGYSRIIDPAAAGVVVADKAQLLDALAGAAPGWIIYVDDAAMIDMTGEEGVTIPAGVTLASGRGREGSPGGMIFTDQTDAEVIPLLRAGGDNVRLTGIRLRGPDPEIGDHDYETDILLSRGIQSNDPGFEVDDCEVSGWSHAGIFIAEGCTGARVHHSFIHHNRRTGLGYGVCLGYSTQEEPIDVVIEANLFDYCRHHIASTGNPFGSYEARYNMVLEHANGSNFDRHGTVDPGTWVGGTGGDWTIVHHNTVRFTDSTSVGIRGVPVFGCEVYRNWFYNDVRDEAVWFFEEADHPDVYSEHDNFFSPRIPPGTYLPAAAASAWPPMGRAPLAVSFDGSGSCDPVGAIVTYRWDFGNGEGAEGSRVDYEFRDPGRYNVSLTVTNEAGIPARVMVPVTVYPAASTYVLDFWVKDGYRGNRTGYYVKQALVDGQVVWEDDVAEDEGWVHVSTDVASCVEGKTEVDLALRAAAVGPVTDPETELIELDVYWDDVFLFGGDIPDGDFEVRGGWTYAESAEDVPWTGNTRSGEVRSGTRSTWTTHPYNTPSTAGTWGQVERTVRIGDPDVRGRWLFDEPEGMMARDGSMFGNHGILTAMDPATARVEGRIGHALAFDGEDDHVDCGRHPSLTSPEGTIELWMSAQGSGGEADIMSILDESGGSGLTLKRDAAGMIRVVVEDGGSAVLDVVSGGAAAADGFHHVAVTQDGSGARIFIDGAESAAAGTNSGAWTDHLVLGGAWLGRGPEGYFAGTLDNVVLYSRALPADEILTHVEQVNPRGQWHLDEASGTTASDSSPYGNHCTLMNMDAAACWVEGMSWSALGFDGVDDLAACGEGESLLLTGDMTIEMWVRFDGFVENENVLSNDLYRVFHRGGWAGDRLYFLYRIAETAAGGDSAWDGWSGVATETNLTAGEWAYVAAVKSGETMSLFIDGRLEKQVSCLSGLTVDASRAGELRFGEQPFHGAVDEITIHPRTLGPDEIFLHYAMY